MTRIITLLHSAEDAKRINAWNKASPTLGRDPDFWRIDAYGSLIYWGEYGNRSSQYGWEIHHYPNPIPAAAGGAYTPSNLRALHWRNNASHGGLLSALLRARGRR